MHTEHAWPGDIPPRVSCWQRPLTLQGGTGLILTEKTLLEHPGITESVAFFQNNNEFTHPIVLLDNSTRDAFIPLLWPVLPPVLCY